MPFHLNRDEIQAWSHPPASFRIPFDPPRAALLLIDLQTYFTHPDAPAHLPSSTHVLTHLPPLIDAFGDHSRPVIATRHLDLPDTPNLLNRWWKGTIDPDSEWSLLDSVISDRSDTILTVIKHHYDAFFETNLEQLLHEHGVRQLVIGGVMTHLCCETTARSAFMRGFPVYFLVDGTATAHRSFHEATLTNLKHGFADLVSIDGILSCL